MYHFMCDPLTGFSGTNFVSSGGVETGKKRILLLKAKEREDSHVSNQTLKIL